MFVFAHAFLGALVGLGFWHMTDDRRALPLCIFCAILPDLLDKPLALLFPTMFGAGRTLGHALFFTGLAAAVVGMLIWHYRHSALGMACACAVFSHQVLDEMWHVPSIWYYPLMGPFPTEIHPDYILYSFWREISTLSEWVFACALAVIIAVWYYDLPYRQPVLGVQALPAARYLSCLLLSVTGIALILPVTGLITPTWFAPTYAPVTGAMAGILAVGGAVVLFSRAAQIPRSKQQTCDR